MIRVLIADDHAVVRAGLRALLNAETSLKLVAEATGGYEAIELVRKYRPDVLLLDLSMPDLDGIQVTRQLKGDFPELRILILTIHEDEALLREAMRAGACGYILKRAAEAELISAVHVILKGELYVDPALLRALFVEPGPGAAPLAQPVETITPRETDVLKLIVQGFTNRQIGEELSISARTVEGHRASLSEKLGTHSRVDLVRYAREHGLLK